MSKASCNKISPRKVKIKETTKKRCSQRITANYYKALNSLIEKELLKKSKNVVNIGIIKNTTKLKKFN
jgi:hypothetical protein